MQLGRKPDVICEEAAYPDVERLVYEAS